MGWSLEKHRIWDRADGTPDPIQYSQWLEKKYCPSSYFVNCGPHTLRSLLSILRQCKPFEFLTHLRTCIRYWNWSTKFLSFFYFFCWEHSYSSLLAKARILFPDFKRGRNFLTWMRGIHYLCCLETFKASSPSMLSTSRKILRTLIPLFLTLLLKSFFWVVNVHSETKWEYKQV